MSKKYIKINVTAHAGGGQANATLIPESQDYTEVTTVVAENDSLRLPSAQCGSVFTIRNSGNFACAIFPPTGGQIDNLGANNQFIIASGVENTFTVIPNNTLANGGVQYKSNEVPSISPVILYTGLEINLYANDSGSTIFIPNVAGNSQIFLPREAEGLQITMICTGAVSNANNVTIQATGAIIQGLIIDDNGILRVSNRTTIQLGNANGAMSIGDRLNFVCNGTNWFVSGLVADRTHLTLG